MTAGSSKVSSDAKLRFGELFRTSSPGILSRLFDRNFNINPGNAACELFSPWLATCASWAFTVQCAYLTIWQGMDIRLEVSEAICMEEFWHDIFDTSKGEKSKELEAFIVSNSAFLAEALIWYQIKPQNPSKDQIESVKKLIDSVIGAVIDATSTIEKKQRAAKVVSTFVNLLGDSKISQEDRAARIEELFPESNDKVLRGLFSKALESVLLIISISDETKKDEMPSNFRKLVSNAKKVKDRLENLVSPAKASDQSVRLLNTITTLATDNNLNGISTIFSPIIVGSLGDLVEIKQPRTEYEQNANNAIIKLKEERRRTVTFLLDILLEESRVHPNKRTSPHTLDCILEILKCIGFMIEKTKEEDVSEAEGETTKVVKDASKKAKEKDKFAISLFELLNQISEIGKNEHVAKRTLAFLQDQTNLDSISEITASFVLNKILDRKNSASLHELLNNEPEIQINPEAYQASKETLSSLFRKIYGASRVSPAIFTNILKSLKNISEIIDDDKKAKKVDNILLLIKNIKAFTKDKEFREEVSALGDENMLQIAQIINIESNKLLTNANLLDKDDISNYAYDRTSLIYTLLKLIKSTEDKSIERNIFLLANNIFGIQKEDENNPTQNKIASMLAGPVMALFRNEEFSKQILDERKSKELSIFISKVISRPIIENSVICYYYDQKINELKALDQKEAMRLSDKKETQITKLIQTLPEVLKDEIEYYAQNPGSMDPALLDIFRQTGISQYDAIFRLLDQKKQYIEGANRQTLLEKLVQSEEYGKQSTQKLVADVIDDLAKNNKSIGFFIRNFTKWEQSKKDGQGVLDLYSNIKFYYQLARPIIHFTSGVNYVLGAIANFITYPFRKIGELLGFGAKPKVPIIRKKQVVSMSGGKDSVVTDPERLEKKRSTKKPSRPERSKTFSEEEKKRGKNKLQTGLS
ncbi:MAG: hypothetical protein SFT93_01330 [Rickettsiaceae bacterium]|nr:hypothetical protein [Rickettsiaceae bacterium]